MGLSPPSPEMMRHRMAIRLVRGYTDSARGSVPLAGTASNLLPANVSAPEMGVGIIAESEVAVLRCRVMCLDNPVLTDAKGDSRPMGQGDQVDIRDWGNGWTAEGPMVPEASDGAGGTVCWRFDVIRPAS